MPDDMPNAAADTRLLSVETPEAVSFSQELADVGSRGLALLLDMLIIGLIAVAEIVVTGGVLLGLGMLNARLFTGVGAWIAGGLIVALFLTFWGYFVLTEGLRGRTPGKRTMGLRVMRDDGAQATMLDSVVRNLIRLVDLLPGYYAVGLVSALVSSRHKRLGDMAAGTVVVRDSGDPHLYFDGTSDARRTAIVREYLARRGGLTPAGRHQVAAALLTAYDEQPEGWDEPTIAGRLADLSGER